MDPLINHIVPTQGFEIVRDQLGAVLLTELTNQKTLQGIAFPEDINVFSERITPLSEDEDVYVNILLDSANYNNRNQADVEGRTTYFIDIYTNGNAGQIPGTTDSTNKLHKYIGMVRYILTSTQYNTLGLPMGLIGNTNIDSFGILDPALKEDSSYQRFARLQFSVRILENQKQWDGQALYGNDTKVKLDLTNHGYQYKFDN